MARRSHTKASRRPAIVAARVVALCAAVVAFLFAPLRTMSVAPTDDAPPAMKAAPDEDAPVLVEEHGAVVRVPAVRPTGAKPRASATAPALAPSEVALLSTVTASFALEPPRCITARVARARTHAELMVFLI